METSFMRMAQARQEQTFKAILAIWFAWVVFVILFSVGVIWIAVHFISKYW